MIENSERQNQGASILQQFEDSMHQASIMRLLRATHVISELRERKKLVEISNQHTEVDVDTIATLDENSTAWEKIDIEPAGYKTLLAGLSKTSMEHHINNVHVSAALTVYLRSVSLVTDFLQNDKQFPGGYPEQNLNRALNRLILLERLETFLQENYQFDIYA